LPAAGLVAITCLVQPTVPDSAADPSATGPAADPSAIGPPAAAPATGEPPAPAPRQPAPSPWTPDTPEGELAAALIRLVRQLKSRRGADPAMACLGAVTRLGPIRVSTLAEELGLDISTASRHVSHLEAAHLLARGPDPADQRATLLTVTPEGVAHLRQGVLRFSRVLAAATAAWPAPDLTTLTTLMNRLADDLGTADQPDPTTDQGAHP
jgi:DNA-binding MarR family transcriptional regulator